LVTPKQVTWLIREQEATTMSETIRTYNAFGMVVVKKESIVTYVTLVTGDKKISRVFLEDKCYLEKIGPTESITATFGVLLIPGELGISAPDVMQHSNADSGVKIIDIPEVDTTLQDALATIKKTIFGS
jgi:hypothetical protein